MAFSKGQSTHDIPFGLPLAKGQFDKLTGLQKFGYNTAIGTTFQSVTENVNPIQPYLPSARTMSVTTTHSGGDTGSIVELQGLDANYDLLTENVAVGTTSTGLFLRLFRMVLKNPVVGDTNIGTIKAMAQTNPGESFVEYARISPGIGQTLMSIYTIPRGYDGYLISWGAAPSKQKELTAKVVVRVDDNNVVWNTIAFATSFGVPILRNFNVLQCVPEKADIEIRAKALATCAVSANFELILEKKR